MSEERQLRMSLVRVGVSKLVEKLEANQKNHIASYKKALDGWRDECHSALEKATGEYSANTPTEDLPSLWVSVPKPDNHTRDYELALIKLKMSADSFVDLEDAEFRQLVLDEWSWTQAIHHVGRELFQGQSAP